MADQQREFNVAPIDWATRDTGWKPADGDIWYFDGHPDYSGVIYLIGDGTNVTADLDVYYQEWQYEEAVYEFTANNAVFGTGHRVSNTQIRITIPWGKNPLSTANTITVNYPATNLEIIGGGVALVVDGTYTYTVAEVNTTNNTVVVQIVPPASEFSAFGADEVLSFRADGAGGYFTLSVV